MTNKYLEKIAASKWKADAVRKGLTEFAHVKNPTDVTGDWHLYNRQIRDKLGYGMPVRETPSIQGQYGSHHRSGAHITRDYTGSSSSPISWQLEGKLRDMSRRMKK